MMNLIAVSYSEGTIIAGLLLGALTTILWLIIGWRAMKAHEKIAKHLETLSLSPQKAELPSATLPAATAVPIPAAQAPQPEAFRQQNVEQNKLYRHFLSDDSEAAKLPPKERHERFRDWKIKNGFES